MDAQTPAADPATSAPANNFMPDEEVDKVVEEAMRKAREELAAKKKAQDAKEAARKKAAADAAKAKAAEEARKKAAAKKAEEERVAKELMAKEPEIVKKNTESAKTETSAKSTEAVKATDEGAPVNLDEKPAAEAKSVAKKEEKTSQSSEKETKKSTGETAKKSSSALSAKSETASSSRTDSESKKETAKADAKSTSQSAKESNSGSRDEQPTIKTTVQTNDNRPGRSQLTVKATAPAGGVTGPDSANPYSAPVAASNDSTISISGRVLGIMSGPVPRILVRDPDFEFPVQMILPPGGGVMPIPGDEVTGKGKSVGRGNQTVVEATSFKVSGKSVTMPANEPSPMPYGNPEPSAMPPGFIPPPVAPMVPPPFHPLPMGPPPVPF